MKTIYPIFLFLILLTSCHSLVEDEFENFEQIPVMNGLLQADSTFRVQISLSANLADAEPKFVDNALVIIKNTANTADTLNYTAKGWYTSPKLVQVGETYTCIAEIPNFPSISAQTTVPERTVIDSMVYKDIVARGEEGEKISAFEFRILNNQHANKFWGVKLKVRGNRSNYNEDTNEWEEVLIETNKYFYMTAEQDSVLLYEANPLDLFSNQKMKTDSYWVRTYFSEYSGSSFGRNDTLLVELLNVDESYYKYIKQYYIYDSFGESPLGNTFQNYSLYSNVKNGLGLFTGISLSKKDYLATIEED
jgi:hypothetical protein